MARRCSKHPGPWRHLKETGDAVVLYYSQTRSRQEAGLFRCVPGMNVRLEVKVLYPS